MGLYSNKAVQCLFTAEEQGSLQKTIEHTPKGIYWFGMAAFNALKLPCQRLMQYLSSRLDQPISASRKLRGDLDVFWCLGDTISRVSTGSDFDACIDYILIPLNMLLPANISEKQSQLRLLPDAPTADSPLHLDDRALEAALVCMLALFISASPTRIAADPTRLSSVLLRLCAVLTDVSQAGPSSQAQAAGLSENTAAAAVALLGTILCHMLGEDPPRTLLPSLPDKRDTAAASGQGGCHLHSTPPSETSASSASQCSEFSSLEDRWAQFPLRVLQFINSRFSCACLESRLPLPILPPLSDPGPSGHLITQLLQMVQTRTSAVAARHPTKSENTPIGGEGGVDEPPQPTQHLPASVPAQLACAAAHCVQGLVSILAGPPANRHTAMMRSYPEAFRPGQHRVSGFLPGLVSALTACLQPSCSPGAASPSVSTGSMSVAAASVCALQASLLAVFRDSSGSSTSSPQAVSADLNAGLDSEHDVLQQWVAAAQHIATSATGTNAKPTPAASTAVIAGKSVQDALQLTVPRIVRVLSQSTVSTHGGLREAGCQLALSLLQQCPATLRSCEMGEALWLVCMETVATSVLQHSSVLSSGWVTVQSNVDAEFPLPVAHEAAPRVVEAGLKQLITQGPSEIIAACVVIKRAFWEAARSLATAAQRSQASIQLLARRMITHLRLWAWIADHSQAHCPLLIEAGDALSLVSLLVRVLRSADEQATAAARGSDAAGTHMADSSDPVDDERFVAFGQRVPLPYLPFHYSSLVEHGAVEAVENLLAALGWYLSHPASGDAWIDVLEECIEGALLTHAAVFAGWVRSRVAHALAASADEIAPDAAGEAPSSAEAWGHKQDVMLWRRVLVADVPPAVNGKTVVPAHVANYTRAVLGNAAQLPDASGEAPPPSAADTPMQLPPAVSTENYVEAYRGVRQRMLLASFVLSGTAGVGVAIVSSLDCQPQNGAAAPVVLHNDHRAHVIQACAEYIQGELLRDSPAVDVSAALPCAGLVSSAHLWGAPQTTVGDMLSTSAGRLGSKSSGGVIARGGFMDGIVRDVLQGGVSASGLYAENPLPAQNGERVDASRTHMGGSHAPLEIKLPVPLQLARVHRQSVAMCVSLLGKCLVLSGPSASESFPRVLFPLVRCLTSPAYIVRHAVMQSLCGLSVVCSSLCADSPPPARLTFSALRLNHGVSRGALHEVSEHGVSTGRLLSRNAAHLLEPLSAMLRDLKSSAEAPGLLRAVVDLLTADEKAEASGAPASTTAEHHSEHVRALLALAGKSIQAALESNRDEASSLASLLQGAAEFLAAIERSGQPATSTNGAVVFGLPDGSSTMLAGDVPDWAVSADDKWRAMRTTQQEQEALFSAAASIGEEALCSYPRGVAAGAFISARSGAPLKVAFASSSSSEAPVPRILPHKVQQLVHKLAHTARHDFSSPNVLVAVAAGDVLIQAAVALRAVPGELFPVLHRVWPVILPRLVARTWWMVSPDSSTVALWGSGGAPAARKRLTGMTAVRTTRSGDTAPAEPQSSGGKKSTGGRAKHVSSAAADPRGTAAQGSAAAWAVRSAAVRVLVALLTQAWAGQFLAGRWASEGWPVLRNALLGIDDPSAFREAGAFGSSAEDEYASQTHSAGGGGDSSMSSRGSTRLLRIPTVRAALPWLAGDGTTARVDLASAAAPPAKNPVLASSEAAKPGANTAGKTTRLAAAQSFQADVLDALIALAKPLPAPSDKLFRGTSELAAEEVASEKCDEEFKAMYSPAEGGWYLEASPLMAVLDDVLPCAAFFLHPAAPLQLQQRATTLIQRLRQHPGGQLATGAYFGALQHLAKDANASLGPAASLKASLSAVHNSRDHGGQSKHPSSLGTGGEAAADVQRQAQATWGWGGLGGVTYSSSSKFESGANASVESVESAPEAEMMNSAGAHALAELARQRAASRGAATHGRVSLSSSGAAPGAKQAAYSAAVALLGSLRLHDVILITRHATSAVQP